VPLANQCVLMFPPAPEFHPIASHPSARFFETPKHAATHKPGSLPRQADLTETPQTTAGAPLAEPTIPFAPDCLQALLCTSTCPFEPQLVTAGQLNDSAGQAQRPGQAWPTVLIGREACRALAVLHRLMRRSSGPKGRWMAVVDAAGRH
jgi:hypothetical protein